eukprot:4386305-Pyramimonas_sp.AAC.1
MRLHILEDSSSSEGGGDVPGQFTIGVPLASRPCSPCPMVPHPMPSHRNDAARVTVRHRARSTTRKVPTRKRPRSTCLLGCT